MAAEKRRSGEAEKRMRQAFDPCRERNRRRARERLGGWRASDRLKPGLRTGVPAFSGLLHLCGNPVYGIVSVTAVKPGGPHLGWHDPSGVDGYLGPRTGGRSTAGYIPGRLLRPNRPNGVASILLTI